MTKTDVSTTSVEVIIRVLTVEFIYDDFCSGCQSQYHHKQSFSGLQSNGHVHTTKLWHDASVQTVYKINENFDGLDFSLHFLVTGFIFFLNLGTIIVKQFFPFYLPIEKYFHLEGKKERIVWFHTPPRSEFHLRPPSPRVFLFFEVSYNPPPHPSGFSTVCQKPPQPLWKLSFKKGEC